MAEVSAHDRAFEWATDRIWTWEQSGHSALDIGQGMVNHPSESRQSPVKKMTSCRHDSNWLIVFLGESKDAGQAHHIIEFTMNESGGPIDGGGRETLRCQSNQ